MSSNTQAISNEIKLYFEERLRLLGITEEINTITTPVYEGVEGGVKVTTETKSYKAFETNPKGIQINYFLPNGHYVTWKKPGNKWPTNYWRIRLLKEENTEKDGHLNTKKYHQEGSSPVVPYLTPGVIHAWVNQKTIETLILIEGEFKAFKSYIAKLSTPNMEAVQFIGIPGIHGFYGGDSNHKLEINEIIQQVILDCKVKNIVLLLDADTLTIKYKDNKDLSQRPFSFAKAVKNFRNSLHLLLEDKTVELSQVYFMHMKTKLQEKTKGIDDLLIDIPAKAQAIMEDMLNLNFAKTYFDGIMLTDGQTSSIDKYFGIQNQDQFYALYKEHIGSRPFIFRKIKYEWTGEELKYVKSEEADRFARIGINWIKRVKLPNHRDLMEEKIEKWSVAEIKRDYPKHIAEQMINKDIPRYDGFFSLPCWDPENYRRTIHGCYNLMEPLMWDAKPGRIDFTLSFIKHLFQGKGNITWNEAEQIYEETGAIGDQFTLAMDYLTILHQFPKQKTFVPVLVSRDQGTGKSTFLEWLCMLYNGNGCILNNQRFQMNFNGHWASKFIIGLDEGFLDVDKKAEREKLKQMVTANEMFLELKGVDVKTIPYYGHLIICSNDADNVMKMDEEDTRWFVVKVKASEKKDPDLMLKLKAELESWIHYLKHRKIFHPKVDRLWFNPKDFETDQMRKIIEVTKSRIDAVVENWVKDMFLTYKIPNIRISRKTLLKQLNNPEISKYRIDDKELKYHLDERKKMTYHQAGRCRIPFEIKGFDSNMQPQFSYFEENQRHYIFKPEDWLSPKEYQEYLMPFTLSDDENDQSQKAHKEFAESVPLTNKQYEQEKIWEEKKGAPPF